MLRRRRRAQFVAAALVVVALVVAGCGRDDFENNPRPPIPAEVSVKIAKDGVAVSPKEFGAGLANFTIANLTTRPGTLAIHGPVEADSDEIPAAGTTRGSSQSVTSVTVWTTPVVVASVTTSLRPGTRR